MPPLMHSVSQPIAWRLALLRCLLGFVALAATQSPLMAADKIDVHFFWSAECPHCQDMTASMNVVVGADRDILVHRHEVSRDPVGARDFARTVEKLDLPPVVPIVVIGKEVMVGHEPGASGRLQEMIAMCRSGPCPDLVAAPPDKFPAIAVERSQAPRVSYTRSVRLPFIGEVRTSDLSLPILTITMAAVDGFNPCAMWVLVFLIGLLLSIRDRRRMWLLAGTFLLATAAVYFLFLAAWLNVLLVLGALLWLRVAIGVLAMGAGGHYLLESLRREQVCEVTRPERRRRILDRLRKLVQEPNLVVSMIGVALLAVAVNLVELVCSAGIPAVYTGILAQSDLTTAGYYGYLALYILVFLADDTALVMIAMTTLRMVSPDSGFNRWVRFAGGLVMVVLGAMLIFKPEWLAFA